MKVIVNSRASQCPRGLRVLAFKPQSLAATERALDRLGDPATGLDPALEDIRRGLLHLGRRLTHRERPASALEIGRSFNQSPTQTVSSTVMP